MSLAVLDAIISPEWEYRYFLYDAHWGPSEQLASMRNGSGDEYTIVFSDAGAYIRGFDHESPLSPWAQSPPGIVPGLVDDVPLSVRANVDEPAFTVDGILPIIVCLWRQRSDSSWHCGTPTMRDLAEEDGGAGWLFKELDGRTETYTAFAEEYYDVVPSAVNVQRIFDHHPLTLDVLRQLNAAADASVVFNEVQPMGYPVADPNAA